MIWELDRAVPDLTVAAGHGLAPPAKAEIKSGKNLRLFIVSTLASMLGPSGSSQPRGTTLVSAPALVVTFSSRATR